jgi:flagellar hook-associated protein 1 FlgK
MNLASRLNALASSFTTLSASPDSATAQQFVVDQAVNLAVNINKYADFLLKMRIETQDNIASEVANANSYLNSIAEMNKRISQLKSVGSSTASLEDQRDMAVKKLSELMDISYFEDGNGMLVVQTRNGQVLADHEAHPLQFNNSSMTYASYYPDSLSGVTVNPGTQGAIDLNSSSGGKLGALIGLRDQELPSYMSQLDEMAHKIAMRFDAQGLRLFSDSTGGVPANTPNQYVGFALNIQVNDLVRNNASMIQQGTTGGSIDVASNAVIERIINYTFGAYQDASGTPHAAFNVYNNGPGGLQNFPSVIGDNASLDLFARSMLGRQAEEHALTFSQLKTEKAYTQDIQTRLLDGSAVNTDEEMAKMIELQRNYTASAKVINALDELFKALLNAF